MHPKELEIKDFTYHLPDERIAKFPIGERDLSKLLIFDGNGIKTDIYRNINDHLPPNSLLVFNNTKVVEARILFQKTTGALIEVFCLEPHEQYRDVTAAMLQRSKVWWKCLIGGASKWKHGLVLEKQIEFEGSEIALKASIVDRLTDCFVIEFAWDNDHLSFAEVLHKAGLIPLPPYLHRSAEAIDADTYQTIYAQHNGSVAAPTAGLHFTQTIFNKLEQKGISKDFVTLHVGAGTFKPVKAKKLDQHEMHSEFIEVSLENIENLLKHHGRKIVAVGTTSLRTIESLYWMGLKLKNNPNLTLEELQVQQWEPYENNDEYTTEDALKPLLKWLVENKMDRLITKTQILIAPGYTLRIAKGIITNFHQPQSTLLLLIAAIIGDEWKNIYEHALKNDFRFLSYGDGCLLWNKEV